MLKVERSRMWFRQEYSIVYRLFVLQIDCQLHQVLCIALLCNRSGDPYFRMQLVERYNNRKVALRVADYEGPIVKHRFEGGLVECKSLLTNTRMDRGESRESLDGSMHEWIEQG
jgi:hypothetical protein